MIGRPARSRKRAEVPGRPRAELVLRLAVLLQAGLRPGDAWRYLAAAGDPDAAAVAAADPLLAAAIAGRGESWRPLAAAWTVATEVGAPLAASLRAIAAALREADDGRDEIRVALAEPAATARLMSKLPLVAIALGMLLGFDTLGVLVTTPAGWACVVVGVALMLVARRWTARLIRAAQPAPEVAGLVPELMAVALTGGVSIERARSLATAAAQAAPDQETERLLELSHEAGVPAVELLRAAAAMTRHRVRVEGRLRAAALSSRLLLPLGVCVLPAFIALGVAPLLLSVIGQATLAP